MKFAQLVTSDETVYYSNLLEEVAIEPDSYRVANRADSHSLRVNI